MNEDLEVVEISLTGPRPLTDAEMARGVQPTIGVAIRVKNNSSAPLHVWSSRRAFNYDPAKQTLNVHLADDLATQVNPNFQPISVHPRAPKQIIVPAGSQATITVEVPTVVRQLQTGPGLGLRLNETEIGAVRLVEAHIAYADTPYQRDPNLSPQETLERLKHWGQVTVATLPISGHKEG